MKSLKKLTYIFKFVILHKIIRGSGCEKSVGRIGIRTHGDFYATIV